MSGWGAEMLSMFYSMVLRRDVAEELCSTKVLCALFLWAFSILSCP